MAVTDSRRRLEVDRPAFLEYRVDCPFCGAHVGPRSVTREHLDVPPNPPYAATVKCPKCAETFEVLFREG
jgi:transcription elongation factor Elf1